MHRTSILVMFAAASTIVASGAIAQEQPAQDTTQQPAQEQTTQTEGQATQTQQPQQGAGQADQCRENLNAFATQLQNDESWAGGWSGMGFGMSDGVVPPEGTPNDPAGTGQAADMPGYWYSWGYQSPRRQVQVLYSAAQVFAVQGNQEGCDYVLGQLSATYERYRQELQSAGVNPGTVTDWRQEQIALAQDVEEIQGISRFTADRLIGTDVRTRTDQNLGSVNDVVVDPESGEISYLIIARGGFLGIGEELVAVPWDAFAATPGLQTLVLDVDPAQLDNAPTVDSGFWTDQQNYQTLIQETDQYWQTSS